MRSPENLPRHELIGLEVEVVESKNKDEVGISGEVVDERKSILKIESDVERTVKKEGRSFLFKLPPSKKVKIEGKVIEGRPEDRIKKRLKKW